MVWTLWSPAAWGLWQLLTIAEVRKLLGLNLPGLKAEEGNGPTRDWIFRQSQDDLDRLGLGLCGGIPNGYLVLDLHSPGALGPAGGRGQGQVEALSLPCPRRGPVWGPPPPGTWTRAHCGPDPAPGLGPELSSLLQRPRDPGPAAETLPGWEQPRVVSVQRQGDWSSIKEDMFPPLQSALWCSEDVGGRVAVTQ